MATVIIWFNVTSYSLLITHNLIEINQFIAFLILKSDYPVFLFLIVINKYSLLFFFLIKNKRFIDLCEFLFQCESGVAQGFLLFLNTNVFFADCYLENCGSAFNRA